MTETQKNLRTFWSMADKALQDWTIKTHVGTGVEYDYTKGEQRLTRMTSAILGYALADYEIGEPTREDSAIYGPVVTAGMSVHGMNGIIMFRDGEVTSHT